MRDRKELQTVFDPAAYLRDHREEVGEDGDPFVHYRTVGIDRGYRPNDGFDPLQHALHLRVTPQDAAFQALRTGLACPELTDLLEAIPEHAVRPSEKVSLDAQPSRAAAGSFGAAATASVRLNGRTYTINAPSADTFFSSLAAGKLRVYRKLPHGFWDTVSTIELMVDALNNDPRATRLDPGHRRLLATRWHAARYPDNGVAAEGFLREIEAAIGNLDANACRDIAIAFKGAPVWDNRIFATNDEWSHNEHQRLKLFARAFPFDATFSDGVLMKRFAISGDLIRLVDVMADRRTIVVASETFADLSERLQLRHVTHLSIPPRNSHWQRRSLLARIEALLEAGNRSSAPPMVLFQCGGSLAFWLIDRLMRREHDAILLDLGQSLNIWFLDRLPTMPWLRIYADKIVENCGLDEYYHRLGVRDVVARFRPKMRG